ncbi:Protein OS-9 [Entomophthora muscae]|uniref:Protein OS-9 n=1 Tax=Entomophthora muscae TaxID=34485 RepID=A0ACC2SA60_9FUNG|nr:Protein OS-9 [Entomophthora muscae]
MDIINSLKGDCLLMQAGWWTYKFCFNGEVSQFHLPTPEETKAGKGLLVFVLGKFSNSLPVPPPEEKVQTIEAVSGSPNTVIRPTPNKNILVQQWGGGTACNLNSQPRSVEVHYMCIPDHKARIMSIKEPRSCHYLIEINTPQLCRKAFFAEKSKPPVHPIHCAEVVPDAQVESRTKEAAAKKAAGQTRPGNELPNPQIPPKLKLSQLKYLGQLTSDDSSAFLTLLGNQRESKYTSDSSVPDTPAQQEEQSDERSPDKPPEELYGTISKLLDLLKYELSPAKEKESNDDDSQEDEL